jgi:hypothetical protein
MAIVIALSILSFSFAQSEKKFSAFAGNGFIYAHTKDVENTKGSQPFAVQALYTWRKTDSSFFNKWGGLPNQGLAIQYTNYNNAILGQALALNYFIEPEIRITPKAGIAFNIAGGLLYANNPYHSTKNPTNNSYSTHVSFYLGVGLKPYWQIHKHWQLEGWLGYNHISNGGIQLPNKGINWIMTNVGVAYFLQPKVNTKKIIEQYTATSLQKKNRLGISSFFANRSISNESNITYMVAGLQIQQAWQTARTHAVVVGVEMYYDAALKKQMQQDGLNKTALKAGILAGHEFLWGKIGFSQQLGLYIFDKSPYYPIWYHRWGLQYYTKKMQVGVGLKVHNHIALFPELRIGYNWYKHK